MKTDIMPEEVREATSDLETLARDWPFKPYRWSVAPDLPELHVLVLHRLTELVRKPTAVAWKIRCGRDLTALAVLQPLDWDSAVLGMRAARLDLFGSGNYVERAAAFDSLAAAVLERARRTGLQHISIRIDAEDDAAIHVLERNGFLAVDALMTFGARADAIAPYSDPPAGVFVRVATPEDAAAVGDIAAASFVDGRFHSDPSISSHTAAAVYRTWSVNCCERRVADETFVVVDGGRVAGFVACRIQPDTVTHLGCPTGTIVLIATAGAARGRGFGALLVSAAGDWFRSRGVLLLDVGTQLRNIRAARLYERCGYRLVSGALSFRALVTR